MPISDADYKLLWGRAAGICSNPECLTDLTVMLEGGNGFNFGEMAHIIARSAGGPRAQGGKGQDSYANLILLCPICHRKIDKAPEGTYPEQMLHDWKQQHEKRIRNIGSTESFETSSHLKNAVTRLLMENNQLWQELGPKSEVAERDPSSNMYVIWNLRKLDRIVPNNRKIMNLIDNNGKLITNDEYLEFLKFKSHALAFEEHQYHRLDSYPLFPQSFAEAFKQ